MLPKISILIPAFKTAYLKQCLDSISHQNYNNWEAIIVDDCSPEDIKSIVIQYNDDRFSYYRNERNIGALDVVDNWNTCLKYSTGDYCICIGDDDMLPKEALSIYSKYIQKYPSVDVFHARTILIDQNEKPIYITNPRAELESVYSLIRHRMNEEIQFVGDFCYKTSSLKANGGYIKLPLAWGSDDITAYAMAEKHGIVNLLEPSFHYRVNTLSITSNGNVKEKTNATNLQKQWLYDFINRQNAKSIEDELSVLWIRNNMNKYFEKKIVGYIAQDLKHNKYRICQWLKLKKIYAISSHTLITGIVKSFIP